MNKQKKFDFLLLVSVLLLVVIGTSMIYSASSIKAMDDFGDSNFFLKRQMMRVIIGLVLMIVFFFIDYHKLQNISWILLIATILLLLVVLAGGLELNGSRRSIKMLSFVFQPSEAAKYALVLFLSWFLAGKRKKIKITVIPTRIKCIVPANVVGSPTGSWGKTVPDNEWQAPMTRMSSPPRKISFDLLKG